jgi:hypothetical protein
MLYLITEPDFVLANDDIRLITRNGVPHPKIIPIDVYGEQPDPSGKSSLSYQASRSFSVDERHL